MAQFSYDQYQNVVNKAQTGAGSSNLPKVGFFKLAKDGDKALVRFYVNSVADLTFNTIHKPVFGKRYEGLSNAFAGISCLNEVGSYADTCPLCRAAAMEGAIPAKASKQVYVKMLVSYLNNSTGNFEAVVPVIWERPAGFSRELVSKLQMFGNLTERMFIVTRTGAGKDTRYTIDNTAGTLFDKPELVPADFSAFDNYDINRHAFWEKSVEELEAFVAAGSFPETEAKAEAPKSTAQVARAYTAPTTAAPAYTPASAATAAPAAPSVTTLTATPAMAAPTPAATDIPWSNAPAANFAAPASAAAPEAGGRFKF